MIKWGFCFSLLFISQSLHAYDADVHFGLTKWLAIKAGFSPDDAQIIAAADHALDEKTLIDGERHDAVYVVAIEIVLETDPVKIKKASKKVQRDHFLGGKIPPDSASARSVKRGEGDSRLIDELARPNTANWLQHVGQAIHAYQDSWSHSGDPDIPMDPFLELRRDYSWGHPHNRGGWWRHRADLTCADPKGTEDMAEHSLDYLTKLCRLRKGGDCTSSNWKDIEPDVKHFAEANTKELKRIWFNKQKDSVKMDFGDLKFIDDVNIPDKEYSSVGLCTRIQTADLSPARERMNRGHSNVGESDSLVEPGRFQKVGSGSICNSDQFRSRVKDFEEWWRFKFPAMNSRDILNGKEKAIVDYFDIESVQDQLTQWGNKRLDGERTLEWIDTFLNIWWIRDHGLIEALGHGDPFDARYEGLRSILLNPEGRNALRVTSSEWNLHFNLKTVSLEAIGIKAPGDACIVNGEFTDRLPHDIVTFVFLRKSSVDGQSIWRIARLGWLSL